MVRTASIPKATSPLPDINQFELSSEQPVPGILPHPSLLRPKPRKPPPPPSPSQLQVSNPASARQRKGGNNAPRERRRAHSRVSDSGWLTDEIVGGKVDDFDFETNLGKFDKRRVWEEFRVHPPNQPNKFLNGDSDLRVENGHDGSHVPLGLPQSNGDRTKIHPKPISQNERPRRSRLIVIQ
jgi:FDF domain